MKKEFKDIKIGEMFRCKLFSGEGTMRKTSEHAALLLNEFNPYLQDRENRIFYIAPDKEII